MVEHVIGNDGVGSSILPDGTRFRVKSLKLAKQWLKPRRLYPGALQPFGLSLNSLHIAPGPFPSGAFCLCALAPFFTFRTQVWPTCLPTALDQTKFRSSIFRPGRVIRVQFQPTGAVSSISGRPPHLTGRVWCSVRI